MDISLDVVEARLREMCVLLHTEMTAMVSGKQHDSQSDSSFMNLSEVLRLDLPTALSHIEAAIKELLASKHELLDLSHYSVFREQQQYCFALQKLEKEVRGHIQAEHQMSLHIELLQQKVDELEKENEKDRESYQNSLERLQKEYDTIMERLRIKEEKGPKSEANSRTKTNSQRLSDVFRLKLRRVNEPDMEKRVNLLEERLKKAQTDLFEQEKLCQKWRKECDDARARGVTPDIQIYQKRYEEKCLEIAKTKLELGQVLRDAKGKYRIYREIPRRRAGSRSVSPLISTTKREEIRDRLVETYRKTFGKVRRRLKHRSASTERLKSNKSSSGIAGSS